LFFFNLMSTKWKLINYIWRTVLLKIEIPIFLIFLRRIWLFKFSLNQFGKSDCISLSLLLLWERPTDKISGLVTVWLCGTYIKALSNQKWHSYHDWGKIFFPYGQWHSKVMYTSTISAINSRKCRKGGRCMFKNIWMGQFYCPFLLFSIKIQKRYFSMIKPKRYHQNLNSQ
jgi:hypothetical protein